MEEACAAADAVTEARADCAAEGAADAEACHSMLATWSFLTFFLFYERNYTWTEST
jgi:hypothetical protein